MKNERDSDIATITSHFFGAHVKSEGFQQNLGESKMSMLWWLRVWVTISLKRLADISIGADR